MRKYCPSIGKIALASVFLWLSPRTTVIGQALPGEQQLQSDTLRVGLDSAENIFVRQNLSLLAQRYNVSAQDALVLQAKLWPNPNLSLSTIIYNGDAEKWFAFGFPYGEVAGNISQLIMLAGKRGKSIDIAKANTKLAQYQLYDLLRTLKYTLRTDFYNIYYLMQTASVYDQEIRALQQVVTAYNAQAGKGYIAESEVVQIKAQLYSLQSEYNDLINQINDTESELKLVMQVKNTVYVAPIVDTMAVKAMEPSKYGLGPLIDSAMANRTDLMVAKENTEINKLQYSYQKALAVPDLTLSLNYDQQGSFVHNFTSFGASIDLPFLNRNQGNIKSAKAMIGFAEATQKSTELTVQENVYRALQKAYANQKLYQNIDPAFAAEFEALSRAELENYEKRNIGLLQFQAFYDAYKQNVVQVNTILFNRVSSFEDLNFYTGTNLY
ncbi:TolC family protein [Dinghuibacter silviterrae]|uniref:Cobalt-zinc-cadmium efflux system outer membrane protein n=1 Tax=Dinghuibacter silviterrae TaxID=1539049 RepID=A0A4R8DN72_9BACT|nr:TolC family protein [Dinghuibacter silviterrae]TDW99453.1 cobalt-zinc-cadmium efflux system outer membrane protein [Dinghuibacter silviterrae]